MKSPRRRPKVQRAAGRITDVLLNTNRLPPTLDRSFATVKGDDGSQRSEEASTARSVPVSRLVIPLINKSCYSSGAADRRVGVWIEWTVRRRPLAKIRGMRPDAPYGFCFGVPPVAALWSFTSTFSSRLS